MVSEDTAFMHELMCAAEVTSTVVYQVNMFLLSKTGSVSEADLTLDYISIIIFFINFPLQLDVMSKVTCLQCQSGCTCRRIQMLLLFFQNPWRKRS